jgi:hypothetical protein
VRSCPYVIRPNLLEAPHPEFAELSFCALGRIGSEMEAPCGTIPT